MQVQTGKSISYTLHCVNGKCYLLCIIYLLLNQFFVYTFIFKMKVYKHNIIVILLYLSVHLSIHSSISLSIHPFIVLSICPFVIYY